MKNKLSEEVLNMSFNDEGGEAWGYAQEEVDEALVAISEKIAYMEAENKRLRDVLEHAEECLVGYSKSDALKIIKRALNGGVEQA